MESSSGLTKDLQSKQMKRTPQDYVKKLIIWILNPLAIFLDLRGTLHLVWQ